MAGIADKVPEKNDRQLLALFRNAHEIASGRRKGTKEKESQARDVINAIENEWLARLKRAEKGNYESSLPEVGMLKTLGYTVGNEGESKQHRQAILKIVFESELPMVGSAAYTFEWGRPNTKKRFDKMHRTLEGLIANADTDWEKAITDWTDDLEYIQCFRTRL